MTYSIYGSISSRVHRSRVLNKCFRRSIKLTVKCCSIIVRTHGTFATDRSIIPIPRRKLSWQVKMQPTNFKSISTIIPHTHEYKKTAKKTL